MATTHSTKASLSLFSRLVLLVHLSHLSFSLAQDCVPASDAEVLLATPWAAQVGWASTAAPADWPGVTCDDKWIANGGFDM